MQIYVELHGNAQQIFENNTKFFLQVHIYSLSPLMEGGGVKEEGVSSGRSNTAAPPELRRRRRVAEQTAREGRSAT
jgi:hypothetical protein